MDHDTYHARDVGARLTQTLVDHLTPPPAPTINYATVTAIRTNNVIERLNREIRRRVRVVGTFPDGNSALMLVCARLRHVAGTQWGSKKYMNMKHLETALDDAFIAG